MSCAVFYSGHVSCAVFCSGYLTHRCPVAVAVFSVPGQHQVDHELCTVTRDSLHSGTTWPTSCAQSPGTVCIQAPRGPRAVHSHQGLSAFRHHVAHELCTVTRDCLHSGTTRFWFTPLLIF
ncbi:hypothetical protein ACOMHN_026134 [Nucella lapillus]